MTGLLDSCEELFASQDLYKVLGVESNASDNELKKAYHRVSLKVHPDRVDKDEKQEATQKFQTLGKVYSILCDKDRRAVYDESGEVDDENIAPDDRDWDQYWRLLFKKITVEDIKNFEAEYKESDEELNDLKQAYIEGEGDMEYILQYVLCCTIDDEARFTKIIHRWIKKKEVPNFSNFSNETKRKKETRKRKAAAEAEEAEEMKKELGLGDTTDSLKALILKRGKQREAEMDCFLDSLATKYGGGGSSKKKSSKKGGKK
ncbi:dnaJ homolog subfamily C member 9-like [Homarus americanus]|uniref:DnaJ subfamily C member 9-like n=1 Tax=Homarus americanus TaxID=6706 RepID=A0A8J5N1L1_HOMAM|nr:dnaJ homolog subfamily C member 9-like [Homarus americanus]KAG7171566.1 DnaJ subfamily C member 9-like [Homarus americanus]